MSRGNEKRKLRKWRREIRWQSTITLLDLLDALGVKSASPDRVNVKNSIRQFTDRLDHIDVRPGPGY